MRATQSRPTRDAFLQPTKRKADLSQRLFSSTGRELDRYDIAILSNLNDNPRIPASELADLVHLSRTAVSRRLSMLRDAGLYANCPEIVSIEALGFDVRAFVELRPDNRRFEQTRRLLLERPEVLRTAVVSGKSLLIAEVIAMNLAHLDDFMRWAQGVGNTETKIVFSMENSCMPLADRLEALRERQRPTRSISLRN